MPWLNVRVDPTGARREACAQVEQALEVGLQMQRAKQQFDRGPETPNMMTGILRDFLYSKDGALLDLLTQAQQSLHGLLEEFPSDSCEEETSQEETVALRRQTRKSLLGMLQKLCQLLLFLICLLTMFFPRTPRGVLLGWSCARRAEYCVDGGALPICSEAVL